ncbi:DNA excision repair protein ERCC-3 [Planifilum fulgidum]|jgi:DNA excision repair protein ERCC-3|uniref:DNA 3'-5' helicase n=1 Tax=Planifilum fulgidum TaxID=201973 RepID=A0A1I2MTW6_9BACL|nr:DNA repair helicase XPB [Planifilum fulgidum]MBO2532060.1 helicase [Thermoactinomycetaceae bacterium]SFF92937.1 DNA excision repair protein ERCC-3 [Planifilum fulgidum]
MSYRPENPLVVQSDRTVLLEVNHPRFAEIRDRLSAFAELVKSPEYVHVYRITPLSLWNAAAKGMKAAEMLELLTRYGKFPLPPAVEREIADTVSRYGRVRLENREGKLVLTFRDSEARDEVLSLSSLKFLREGREGEGLLVPPERRGQLKRELLRLGYPVEDVAGYSEGEPLPVRLRRVCRSGRPFRLRDYQVRAVEAFHQGGAASGGSGVFVLPCGAGKTVVGLAVMERVGQATLILTTNATSVRQWIGEILDKTDLPPEWVGEYTGDRKEVRPVTVATYQILTHRGKKDGAFEHMQLFQQRNWGLIIYDEVHLLPAPIFRATADLQAKRRLGLTATLIREDGREGDVFSLIGPKRYEVPWKELEDQGWIARAECIEIRVPMTSELRRRYMHAAKRRKYRIAAENPGKIPVLEELLDRHRRDRVLVIGQYLSQLREIAARLSAPLITGQMRQASRDLLFDRFRRGEIPVLVVSKVANFAVDLPDANVAIQVSGTFGSRQEEAQRLGRILRPKAGENRAYFYNLVTRDSLDQEYALHRQLFLVEQGYHYEVREVGGWEGNHVSWAD